VRKSGYYDLTMTVALERYLRPGMTVINVGANVGYFAAISALRTKSEVLCVEPHPRCLEALTKNKELYPQLKIFPCVASDHVGTESFILDAEATGNSSIAPSAVGTTIQVQANTLDNIAAGAKVDVMVIDAQGAEVKIMRGSERLLKQLSLIFFEFWPYGLEAAGCQAEELLAQFHSHGFSLSHFFPSFHPDPEKDPAGLIASLKRQDRGMGFCNLLASKKVVR
jgi:FkbM family methyltransferase